MTADMSLLLEPHQSCESPFTIVVLGGFVLLVAFLTRSSRTRPFQLGNFVDFTNTLVNPPVNAPSAAQLR